MGENVKSSGLAPDSGAGRRDRDVNEGEERRRPDEIVWYSGVLPSHPAVFLTKP